MALWRKRAADTRRHRSTHWFVDPLDGTTNFAHSFPIFNVTLGLARGEEMIAGVVFDPMKNELFTAERGSGAYLNNRRIHVSSAKRMADSLSSTGFPSRKRHHNANIYFYYQLAMASHGVRRTGSAAIDMAYVACGRLDFFWEFGLKPWDVRGGKPAGSGSRRPRFGHAWGGAQREDVGEFPLR